MSFVSQSESTQKKPLSQTEKVQALDIVIRAYGKINNQDYMKSLEIVREKYPNLFQEIYGGKR